METIIVPTDFSPAASNALDYAVELAKFFDARIVLVNAFPVPIVNYEMPFPIEPISVSQKEAEEQLEILKKEIQSKHEQPLNVECVVGMGSPFDIIEETVKEKNADLIVIGIVGEASNIKEHIIGSTAIDIARKLDLPTFIIPESAKFKPIHKISFACDLEKTEKTDLIYVVKFFSKVFDADLEVVNVGPPTEQLTTEKAVTYLYMEDRLKNVKHTTFHIDGEDVAEELESYYKGYPTDVIMLNPKKHNLFYRLFNHSVTKKLAFHLNLPILAIH
jgi:nucleotide-binding universal stress UspA family protein